LNKNNRNGNIVAKIYQISNKNPTTADSVSQGSFQHKTLKKKFGTIFNTKSDF